MRTEVLLRGLSEAPALVAELVHQTLPHNLKRRPAPDRWSVHEHACHLADVHPIFFQRLDVMLAEVNPKIVPFDPPAEQKDGALLQRDLAAELRRFTDDRARLVQRLSALSSADWKRTGEHGEYKPYDIAIMFRHVLMHDMVHGYRIEELALRRDWA